MEELAISKWPQKVCVERIIEEKVAVTARHFSGRE
jgi:hypothetical protein